MRQPGPLSTRRKGPGDKVRSGRLKGLAARGVVQTGAAGVSQSQFDVISIIMPEPPSRAATRDAAREREEPSATDAPHESNPSRSLIMDKLATESRTFATRNNLSESSRSQAADLLNRRLADAIDLQTQCKQAHWNVKGPAFIALHKLFDEIHASVAEYSDLLAERIVALGGVAHGTAREVAEQSELDEYPMTISTGEDHVKCLSAALAEFGSRMRFAIAEADELEDAVSADICTEIARGADKWLWFVEAHGQAKA